MKTFAGNFNSIDVYFLAVMCMAFAYLMALSLLFYVAPRSSQYFYSLIDAKIKSNKIFLSFLVLEVYAKTSQTFMMATEAFVIIPTLLLAAFGMHYLRR